MTPGPDTSAAARRGAPERFVIARVADIPPGERLIATVGGREIGVFNVDGQFTAMLNRCPHLGGPLCEGPILDLVVSSGPGDMSIDRARPMLTCPWHAWEFDLRTGQSYVDPRRMRARQYRVDVQDGEQLGEQIDAAQAAVTDGGLAKGPYVAEMIAVTVEDDYIVVSMRPGAGGPEGRAVRGTWEPAAGSRPDGNVPPASANDLKTGT